MNPKIIRYAAQNKKIEGARVVELFLISGIIAPDFLVAKLIYKIIRVCYFFSK